MTQAPGVRRSSGWNSLLSQKQLSMLERTMEAQSSSGTPISNLLTPQMAWPFLGGTSRT